MDTTGFIPDIRFPGSTGELTTKRKSFECAYDGDLQLHLNDDVNSTMSESSSGLSGFDHLVPSKTTERHASATEDLHGHESDVDSGIVSYQLMDNHTASISSSETDSNRESTTDEQKSRSSSDPTQSVRFDEQLHLSEENIRRSCRKLFATLYSHRFSYPCYNDSVTLSKGPEVPSVSRSKENAKSDGSSVPHINELEPHSKSDAAKVAKSLVEHENRDSMERTPACNIYSASTVRKEDCSDCKNTRDVSLQYRRSESNIVDSSPKLVPDIKERDSERTKFTLYGTSETGMNGIKDSERILYGTRNASSAKEQTNHRIPSVGQCLASVSQKGSDIRRPKFFLRPFPSQYQENSYFSYPCSETLHGKSLRHKSLSCTVLSSSENLPLSLIPNGKPDTTLPRRTSDPISLSSFNISDGCRGHGLERTSHRIPQVTTRSSMVRAYARVVPIVSDDSISRASTDPEPRPLGIFPNAGNGPSDTSFFAPSDTISTHSKSREMKSAPTETTTTRGKGIGQGRRNIIPAHETSSYKDLNYFKRSEQSCESGDVVYSHPNFSVISNQKYASRKTTASERIPASSRENDSSYRSLALNYFKSNGNRKSYKVEYDVMDQSQKNRFNSLPVLDNLAHVDSPKDGGGLTINSKIGLHQSDLALYRNRPSPSSSSTSGKSLLERIHGFTRSAKNAVQKAFSTERIYRPEREERYEAEGHQKLKRSHSFIRGLRERMSKKKKRREKKKPKNVRPPAVQVVIQERLNTSWDEPVLGSSSVPHVEGQLLQLHSDGSQVIELTKPPSKPYGFFVARGRIRNSRGVFVSRMRDQETEERLMGLLGIGDEILEIEGLNVKHSDILEVNSLMAQRNSLILTILPYVCRKD